MRQECISAFLLTVEWIVDKKYFENSEEGANMNEAKEKEKEKIEEK